MEKSPSEAERCEQILEQLRKEFPDLPVMVMIGGNFQLYAQPKQIIRATSSILSGMLQNEPSIPSLMRGMVISAGLILDSLIDHDDDAKKVVQA